MSKYHNFLTYRKGLKELPDELTHTVEVNTVFNELLAVKCFLNVWMT